jgi:GT2 family glycosyltransferase
MIFTVLLQSNCFIPKYGSFSSCSESMNLSIIIVNYRSSGLLLDCLQTIHAQTTGIQYEVIVVNNDEKDKDREMITAPFPLVKWINMGYNAGFARANNAGIRAATGEVVLLLNPDTLVLNGAIEKCYRDFAATGYVACGVQLIFGNGQPQISGSYAMKGGLNLLLPLPYIGQLVKWAAGRVKVAKPHVPEATGVVEVDWINGAFLMVKKTAIEKAGLLDEDFFLYAEETEWCSRLRKIGKLCLFGQYRVMHLEGQSSDQAFGATQKGYYHLSNRKGLQMIVSNMVRVRKEFGTGWFLFLLLSYSGAALLYWPLGLLHNLFRLRNPFAHVPDAAGFTANMFRLWALMPRIVRNKPYFYKVL